MKSSVSLWVPRRLDLLRALNEVDQTIGDLYHRAIETLNDQQRSMGALVVASHCIREIVNSLPDILGDVDRLPDRSDISGPGKALERAWDRHARVLGPPDVPVGSGESSGTHSKRLVAVPTELLEAARLVVVASQAATTNGRLRSSALVLGRLERGRDATVELFRDSVSFFRRYVHLDRAKKSPVPSDAEILKHLESIEYALQGRIGRFFETLEDILDLVELANRRTDQEQS